MNGVHDAERLKELQALPLSRKILITQTRIIEWYQHFNGCVCVCRSLAVKIQPFCWIS